MSLDSFAMPGNEEWGQLRLDFKRCAASYIESDLFSLVNRIHVCFVPKDVI